MALPAPPCFVERRRRPLARTGTLQRRGRQPDAVAPLTESSRICVSRMPAFTAASHRGLSTVSNRRMTSDSTETSAATANAEAPAA